MPSPRGKLLLFDIDGTLLNTGGAGTSAMLSAFRATFAAEINGRSLPTVSFAGSTDRGILHELCAWLEFQPPASRVEAFFASYLEKLGSNLLTQDPGGSGRLPGVGELLDAIRHRRPQDRINLLTGNIQPGAWLKVAHYGLREHFSTGAFGDDHHDRNALLPVAVARENALTGRTFAPQDVVVIGDTPKDIACGKAHGARTLAVATGSCPAAELARHAPCAMVADFRDPEAVLRVLESW